MLRWFRLHASLLASTLLVALLALAGATAAPHAEDCHDACLPARVEHDESAHRFEGVPDAADSHTLHCLVCHWVRAFRPHASARIATAVAADGGTIVHLDAVPVVRRTQVAQPPLRSPPVSSVAF
jgi:hypothetical protein